MRNQTADKAERASLPGRKQGPPRCRTALLTLCAVPSIQTINLFKPDAQGAVQAVSRQEAIDRHLPVYIGKPSSLDKVFQVQGGGLGSIRYVVNGLTAGQLKYQRITNKQDVQQEKAA